MVSCLSTECYKTKTVSCIFVWINSFENLLNVDLETTKLTIECLWLIERASAIGPGAESDIRFFVWTWNICPTPVAKRNNIFLYFPTELKDRSVGKFYPYNKFYISCITFSSHNKRYHQGPTVNHVT